uniref:HTH_48 domain-containing protein n=1 Tax=Syphacia muris TaxID=451379 RepID=A0A0N5AUW6_9BILA
MDLTVSEVVQDIENLYSKNAITARTVHRCFKRFRERRVSLADEICERNGCERKLTLNNEISYETVQKNPYTSVRKLAREVGVLRGTVFRHLRKIRMTKTLNKWVGEKSEPQPDS